MSTSHLLKEVMPPIRSHPIQLGRHCRSCADNSVMAYDYELATRVRELVGAQEGVTEQHMFGGLAFLINGNMAVAASGQGGLLVRVDRQDGDALIDDQHVRPMVMGGKAMRGWLRVDADAVDGLAQLEQWVSRGVSYARSLPSKGPR